MQKQVGLPLYERYVKKGSGHGASRKVAGLLDKSDRTAARKAKLDEPH